MNSVPFVRVTVVGAAGIGKTRLIDSYVNSPPEVGENDYQVPNTTRLELYYKLVELAPDVLPGSTGPSSVLVEIEDSPPSTLLALRQTTEAPLAAAASVQDERRLAHPMAHLLTAARAEPLTVPSEVKDHLPFGIFSYPREVRDNVITARALTQGRMGVIILFSLTDPQSLSEAMEVHSLIKLIQDRLPSPRQLLCFLLGNKDDLVRSGNKVKVDAEGFSARAGMPYYSVSAASGRDVCRAIDEMVGQLVLTPTLSLFEIRRPDLEERQAEEISLS